MGLTGRIMVVKEMPRDEVAGHFVVSYFPFGFEIISSTMPYFLASSDVIQ